MVMFTWQLSRAAMAMNWNSRHHDDRGSGNHARSDRNWDEIGMNEVNGSCTIAERGVNWTAHGAGKSRLKPQRRLICWWYPSSNTGRLIARRRRSQKTVLETQPCLRLKLLQKC